MKILHITNSLSEGGVESFLFDLCYYTVEKGHQVSILVLNKNLLGMKSDFEQIGVEVLTGQFGYRYNPAKILVIRKYLPLFTIVHVHLFPPQLYTVLAYMSLPLKKRPIMVTTEHSTYNNRRKYSWLCVIDIFFYRRFTKILCISKQTEVNIRKWLGNEFPKKKIVTINNGINVDKFSKASNVLNQVISVEESKDYLIMVGRFAKPKDQLTVIRALNLCPQKIHLIFVGTGPTMQQCKLEAESLGILSRVHFVGYNSNVAGLLKGCKIGILSTQWDGFGLVSVEYMAAGIPVLASNVDGLRDVIGRDDLLFEPGNAKELSDKIVRLLSSSEYYCNVKKYAECNAEKYSSKRMADDYIQIYLSLSTEFL